MQDIYNSFGFLFAKANEQLKDNLKPFLDKLRITPKQMGLALTIHAHPGITQKKAGEIQQIDRTSMTQLVDSMEALDIIKRIPSPNDRRAYGLFLTDNGKIIIKKIWTAIDSVQAIYFNNLNSEELKQLKETMIMLIKEKESV